MAYASNVWVRNVRIINADSGIFLSWVHRSSILGEDCSHCGSLQAVTATRLLATTSLRRCPAPAAHFAMAARRPERSHAPIANHPLRQM